jgi:hypothetical protein
MINYLAFVASNAYGVVVYLISQDKPSNNEMSTLTKYSFVINWINAYVIQWILLLVPYQWYSTLYKGVNKLLICSRIFHE